MFTGEDFLGYDEQEFPYEENGSDEDTFSLYFNENEVLFPNAFTQSSLNTDLAQEINESNLHGKDIKPKKQRKKPENLIPLMSAKELNFMEKFYEHFTGNKNKRVRKELITKNYHPKVVAKLMNQIRDTNREEQRNISKYFIHFAKYEQLIMRAIFELEKEGQINYQRDIQEFKQKKKNNCKKSIPK